MRVPITAGSKSVQTLLPFLIIPLAWQISTFVLPPFLAPSLVDIADKFIGIIISPEKIADVGATLARIMSALVGAFLLGAMLAALMGRSPLIERLLTPALNFSQGIPALSWVVFAIIWFKGMEFRIFFIMIVTTLPAFTFQVLDAFRAMPKDLFEMVASFRPSRMQLVRSLIIPSVLPGILTAWKVNLGNASRVVVVAELVGATGGIGYQLLLQQQLFDMAGAIAWTLQLVAFVFMIQFLIGRIEARLLHYRATSERSL